MYTLHHLPHGLRLVVSPLQSTQAVTVLILTGAGSRYEKPEIRGISHFLEHMFFKGAKKYKTAAEVSEVVDSVGGEFNAFTGKEYAGYYVKVAAAKKEVALDVLSDMMLHAEFRQQEIEKERGVIIEEYNMYQDTPMYQTGWNFERLVFGDQPLGWDQIGTKEVIQRVNHDDFVAYKNALYTADNTVISISGNVNPDEIRQLVEKFFPFSESKKAYDFAPLISHPEQKKVMLTTKKTEQAHLVLGVPGIFAEHEDHFGVKLLSVILGGNMSSRMFLKIREARGLSYYIQTSTDDYLDSGILSTRAGVDVSRVEEAITCIKNEYDLISSEKVAEKELQKAKDYLKGKITLHFEDSEELSHFFAKQALLYKKIQTVEDVFADIDKVTVDDILRIAQTLLQPSSLRLVMIGPYEDAARLESLIR